MLLQLKAIQFNHNSSCASCDAFNIRKNEQDLIEIPEWRRGMSTKPEHSPAAYACLETQGNTLTIKANFSFEGASPQDVCIRALDVNFHQEPVSGSNLSAEEVQLLQNLITDPAGNVIGEVKPKTITVNAGETGFQPFDLQRVRIWDAGVGVNDIVWRWQYCVNGTKDWIDLAVTTHRIYTVVQVPRGPWEQDPTSTQLPWVEVLDFACDWASGTKNADDAAAMITRRVNGLGPNVIHFDMCNHASSHYSDNNNFDCTAFLCRLRGKTGHGPRVNCSDCAAIISTFANSLGCDLEQSPMWPPIPGLPFFPLNEHLRIGLPDRMSGGFIYHEVAWEGQAQESDEVFDACVQVDGDDDPGTFSALLPTNLLFGAIGQRGYRFRLVLTGNEGLCIARPDLKTRRRLGHVSSPRALAEALNLVKGVYSYNLWKKAPGQGTRQFIFDYFFGDFALPGWHIVNQRHSSTRGKRPFIQSFWKRTEGADDVVLRIDVCEGSIWTEAREILLTFLTGFQLPGIELQTYQPELGDVALAGPEPCTILFATANLALLVRNVGRDVFPVMDIVTAMTERLLHPPLIPRESNASFKFGKEFRFETGEAFLGNSMHIIEDSHSSVPREFYQFFAPKGEVFLRGEELFYRPLEVGQHTLDIFAVNNEGAVPTQQLSLTVRNY